MNLSDRPSFAAAAPLLNLRGQRADGTQARGQGMQVARRLHGQKGIGNTVIHTSFTPPP